MAVNTFKKTKYIIFHTRGKQIDPQGKFVIFYNNEPANPFKNELVAQSYCSHWDSRISAVPPAKPTVSN